MCPTYPVVGTSSLLLRRLSSLTGEIVCCIEISWVMVMVMVMLMLTVTVMLMLMVMVMVTVMVKKSPDGVSLLVASPPTPAFGPPVLLLLLLVSESSASDDLSLSNSEI